MIFNFDHSFNIITSNSYASNGNSLFNIYKKVKKSYLNDMYNLDVLPKKILLTVYYKKLADSTKRLHTHTLKVKRETNRKHKSISD